MIAAAKPRRDVRRKAAPRRAAAAVNGHGPEEVNPALLALLEKSFKDIDEGRVVDMETALYEVPPRA